MTNIVKICKIHGDLTLENTVRHGKDRKGEIKVKCRMCQRDYQKTYRLNNLDKSSAYQKKYRIKAYLDFRMRWATIKRKFNVTKEQYETLSKKQKHLCAICKKPETMPPKNKVGRGISEFLCIDHCHKTGKIRGLLCRKCNAALGGFKDSIEYLQSAIFYLKLHRD